MSGALWQKCLDRLEDELTAQQFNTWIRPLQTSAEERAFCLLAPNHFVRDWVQQHYLARIREVLAELGLEPQTPITVQVGSRRRPQPGSASGPGAGSGAGSGAGPAHKRRAAPGDRRRAETPRLPSAPSTNGLRREFTFENFVEGKANQLARAASVQVGANPGSAYNPLFIYGGVGLGKTHLMHAVGNMIVERNGAATVVYLHSERFVQDMVKALQHNTINEFKRFYRSVDALLIDDIQFFAGKERTQEEFFHTFNALLEEQHQIVLTCDRYPKEVDALEERLKSRFGWGLPVPIEPPELEMRVAILKQKAAATRMVLPDEVAFFVAQRIRSNVRELEGALRRVSASSQFTGRPVSLELTREALKDLLAMQDKLVTIENIQKTVAQYFKIRVADLISKRRTRSVARPRQVAMALAKELTNHSLPEIGDAFGGRDHTTVLHACRKVAELRENDRGIDEDYTILLRTLST